MNSSNKLCLILGNQLFERHFAFDDECDVLMIESKELFRRHNYHKQKILFTLTSMRDFASVLQAKLTKSNLFYYQIDQSKEFGDVIKELSNKYSKIVLYEVTDKPFESNLIDIFKNQNIAFEFVKSPMFLNSREEMGEYYATKKGKRLLMNDFYLKTRRDNSILMEDGQPVFGKFSFDEDNRKKIPKNIIVPKFESIENQFLGGVKIDIEKYFKNNPGKIVENWLCYNSKDALSRLHFFFEQKLNNFGDYEDAIDSRDDILFHSAISPYLNNGLLTPQKVLDELFDYINKNGGLTDPTDYNSGKIRINNVEGFVRQIIGWREWVFGLYRHVYNSDFFNHNFFNSNNKLPKEFWFENLDSFDNLPLKDALTKLERLGYSHHIERLMILSNYCVINAIEPKEVYEWFVSMYVDAYEWVMVPNVYGMALFADGGIFATKPYVASSNYILKMSNYKKGGWQKYWDESFWKFLLDHQNFFSKNPRMSMLIKSKLNKTKK